MDFINNISIKRKVQFCMLLPVIWDATRNGLIRRYAENRNFRSQLNDLLPPLSSKVRFYYILSNSFHMLNVVTSFALIYNNIDSKGNEEWRGFLALLCYAPRFFVHPVLGMKYMTWLGLAYSSLTLAWRWLIVFYERYFILETLVYLLLDDAHIEAHLDARRTLRMYQPSQRRSLALVEEILFFKVDDKLHNRLEYRVRPNRTPEARARLKQITHRCFLWVSIFFLLCGLSLVSIGLKTAFSRLNDFYPHCDPEPPGFAQLVRGLMSSWLSGIIFIDCVGTLFYPLLLLMVIVYDLRIYWQHVWREMGQLSHAMSEYRIFSDAYRRPGRLLDNRLTLANSFVHRDDGRPSTVDESMELSEGPELLTGSNRSSFCGGLSRTPDSKQMVCSNTSGLGRRIYVFQWEMGDFFAKISESDRFVSRGLGYSFVIWTLSNAVITFTGLQLDISATAFLIRVFQFIMLICFCTLSGLILSLKKDTDPGYGQLSSLMARDPTIDKRRWMILLKYYTGKSRHAFTIIHTKLYTWLIFFKYFSYTITFALYVHSFRDYTEDETF